METEQVGQPFRPEALSTTAVILDVDGAIAIAMPGEMHHLGPVRVESLVEVVEPGGDWKADAPHVVLPDREKMKTQMEALIYHFKIVTEGFRVPEGEVFQVIESPRGELGYYVVSDGTTNPYRVHMRTPSFGNLQSTAKLVEGTLIADVIAAIGSMDFVLGDTDR